MDSVDIFSFMFFSVFFHSLRAQIRQILLNINLKSERASREEIAYLKNAGVLGKRAPSCSLLGSEDAVRLLMAFGKEDIAMDLAKALSEYRANNPLRDGTIRPPIDPQAIAPSIRVTFTTPVFSGGDEDSDTPVVPRSTRPYRHIAAAQPLYTPDYDSDTEDEASPRAERKSRVSVIRRPGRSKTKSREDGTSPISGAAMSLLPSLAPTSAQLTAASHLMSSATSHPLVQNALSTQPSSVSLGQLNIARPLGSFGGLRSSALTPKESPTAASSFLSSASSVPSTQRAPASSLASLLNPSMLPKSASNAISSSLLANNIPTHPSTQSNASMPSTGASTPGANASHALPASSSLAALGRSGRGPMSGLGSLGVSGMSAQSQATNSRSFLSSLPTNTNKPLGVFGNIGSGAPQGSASTPTGTSGGIFGSLANPTLLRKST